MRKILFSAIFLSFVAMSVSAQSDATGTDSVGIKSTMNAGLWLHMYPPTGNSLVDSLLLITGLRGGGDYDLMFAVASPLSIGPEIGISGFSISTSSSTASYAVFDIPVVAKLNLSLGDWLDVDAFGGILVQLQFLSSVAAWVDALAGARVALGPIFAEASYVIPLGSSSIVESGHLRVGLGYHARLFDSSQVSQ